jgi:hypothetical protein
LDLSQNSIHVKIIAEIADTIKDNVFDVAMNKIPSYKKEVINLKVEHANNFGKTLDEIEKTKKTKAGLVEEN